MSKIKKVKIFGFKGIRLAEIDASDQDIIVLTGQEESGKSSFLDGIMIAYGGSKYLGDMPVNQNETEGKSKITVWQDDGYTIERTIKNKDSSFTTSLIIKDENGDKVKGRAQAYLDKRQSLFSIRPEIFSGADKESQVRQAKEVMKMAVGQSIDEFGEIWKKYEKNSRYDDMSSIEKIDHLASDKGLIYLNRRIANRTVSTLKPLVENIEVDKSKDIELKESEFEKISKEINELIKKGDYINKVWEKYKSFLDSYNDLTNILGDNVNSEEMKKILDMKKDIEKGDDFTKNIYHQIDVKLVNKDDEKIQQKELIDKLKAKQEIYENQKESINSLSSAKKEVEIYNQELKKLSEARNRIFKEIQLPVDGMEIKDDLVYFDGLPYMNHSESRRLILACTLVMAMNPDLTVLLLNRNGLHEKTFEELNELSKKYEFQLWIEKVGTDKEVGYYFEHGQIIN